MNDKKQISKNPIITTVSPSKLTEGEDFYINERGLFVFMEAYHLKRGFCCESGCLHCPYGFKKKISEL
jgi:Family of unknown function (DUF5522)